MRLLLLASTVALVAGCARDTDPALRSQRHGSESAPEIFALEPSAALEGCTELAYSLRDPLERRVDVLVEVDPEGDGTFVPASQAASPTIHGTRGVFTNANGTTHRFLWDSALDVPRSRTGVTLRMAAEADGARSGWITRGGLTVRNGGDVRFAGSQATLIAPGSSIATADADQGRLGEIGYVRTVSAILGGFPDFDTDGLPDLAIAHPAIDRVTVLVQSASSGFAPPRETRHLDVGDEPVSIVAGDLNRDGRTDLATANKRAGSLSIALQSPASGDFLPATATSIGGAPVAIAIADVDRDGGRDVIAADATLDRIAVLRQRRALPGTFEPPSFFGAGRAPAAVQIVDVDADGKLDVVVANQGRVECLPLGSCSRVGAGISLLRGNGNGGFATAVFIPMGTAPEDAAAADLDRDGRVDLIIADPAGGRIVVRFQSSATEGAFDPPLSFPAGTAPRTLALLEVDGDGWLDVAAGDPVSGTVWVLLGEPSRSFTSALGTGAAGSRSIAAGDLDRDGRMDLVGTTEASAHATVLLSRRARRCNAGLDAPRPFLTQYLDGQFELDQVLTTDVDGDAKTDLLLTGTIDTWFARGDGSGNFHPPVEIAETTHFGRGGPTMVRADFDDDGAHELVAVDQWRGRLLLVEPGTWAATELTLNEDPAGIAVADFNGDGWLDIVAAIPSDESTRNPDGATTGSLLFSFQDATAPGAFLSPVRLVIDGEYPGDSRRPSWIRAADVDEDGLADIATADSRGIVMVLRQDPGAPGTFLPHQEYANGWSFYDPWLGVQDVDRDGRLDLIASSSNLFRDLTWVLFADPERPGEFVHHGFENGQLYDFATVPAFPGDHDGDCRIDFLLADGTIATAAPAGPDCSGFTPLEWDSGVSAPVTIVPGGTTCDTRTVAGSGSATPAAITFDLDYRASSEMRGTLAHNGTTVELFPTFTFLFGMDQPWTHHLVSVPGDAAGEWTLCLEDTSSHTWAEGTFTWGVRSPRAGTLIAPRPFLAPAKGIDDLDGDRYPDAIGKRTAVLHDRRQRGAIAKQDAFGNGDPRVLAVADLDADGRPDVAVADAGGRIWTASGSAESPRALTVTELGVVAGTPSAMAIGDLDDDGRPDLAVATSGTDGRLWILRQGPVDGTFDAALPIDVGDDPAAVDIGDLDGDGLSDIVVGLRGSTSAGDLGIVIQRAGMPGTFRPPAWVDAAHPVLDVEIADFDGNGRPELLVGEKNQTWGIFEQNAFGEFVAKFESLVGFGTSVPFVVAAELDGDGYLDVLLADDDGDYFVLANDVACPQTGFCSLSSTWTGRRNTNPSLADLDDDGVLDLVTTSRLANSVWEGAPWEPWQPETESTVTVMRGTSPGRFVPFAEMIRYEAGDAPRALLVEDIDADGRFDVAAIDEHSLRVLWGR